MTDKSATTNEKDAKVPAAASAANRAPTKDEVTTEVKRKTESTVSANPATVEWPHDDNGVTSMLKREGSRAAGRVNGHRGKLDTVLATLDVLRAHTIARYKKQVEQNKYDAEQKQKRDAEAAMLNDRARRAAIAKRKAALAAEEAALEAEEAELGNEDATEEGNE